MWNDLGRKIGLEEDKHGFKTGGININNPWFADNITLIAEYAKDLQTLVLKVKAYSEEMELKWNITNAKLRTTGRTASLRTDEEDVKMVDSFCILG